jgi:DNA-binding protein YbaB
MFDILSKLGEIKEKAGQLKTKVEATTFTNSDDNNLITITTNGKKDITSIKLSEGLSSLSLIDQEKLLNETLKKALNESEGYIMNELKSIIPNIPGMNIFG